MDFEPFVLKFEKTERNLWDIKNDSMDINTLIKVDSLDYEKYIIPIDTIDWLFKNNDFYYLQSIDISEIFSYVLVNYSLEGIPISYNLISEDSGACMEFTDSKTKFVNDTVFIKEINSTIPNNDIVIFNGDSVIADYIDEKTTYKGLIKSSGKIILSKIEN